MKLAEFAASLNKLVEEGHGDLPVFYRHGSSGDCGELSSAHVTDRVEDTGPFIEYEPDLQASGGTYVSIYAGN